MVFWIKMWENVTLDNLHYDIPMHSYYRVVLTNEKECQDFCFWEKRIYFSVVFLLSITKNPGCYIWNKHKETLKGMKKAVQLGIWDQRNETVLNILDFLFALYIPKWSQRSQNPTCTQRFTTFLMVPKWKQPSWPSLGEKLHVWYIRTMEYDSARKRNSEYMWKCEQTSRELHWLKRIYHKRLHTVTCHLCNILGIIK